LTISPALEDQLKEIIYMPARQATRPVDKLGALGQLVTIDEVAAFLGTSRRTIETLMVTRKITFIKIGHSVRFRVRDLEKLLDEYTIEKEAG
jgi:excisionase family DNA binding protein